MYQNLTNATLANKLKEATNSFYEIIAESFKSVENGLGYDNKPSTEIKSDLGQQLQGLNSWR